MKRKNIHISIFLILLLIVTGCGPEDSSSQQLVRVSRVVDGDTFVISGGQRVRLIGIDTPESVKPRSKPEAYGKEASAYTRNLLEGQQVLLVHDVEKKDKYGRLLAYVYLEDGRFVNEILVREGYAQVMTVPPNVVHAEDFLRWQREARNGGKGLWGKTKKSK
ncbi:MAG: thermonuclease family protein [Thermincolia bacterium]